MAHQMIFTLTDAEYAALSRQAAQSGKPLEDLLHEVLALYIHPSSKDKSGLSRRIIQNYLYRAGITENIPTDEPSTEEEKAEREYLAHLFGQGKSVSDMVIEDRGPR